eukprot:SAG31_NODE_338_length_17490_cov_7.707032_6_plen_59_part_00
MSSMNKAMYATLEALAIKVSTTNPNFGNTLVAFSTRSARNNRRMRSPSNSLPTIGLAS